MCPIPFDATLPLQATAAQDWVRLLLMVQRQLQCPDTRFSTLREWAQVTSNPSPNAPQCSPGE
jgi:hypothetical protein